ncbi:hypothetical protein D915_009149 [Fasciola hepatica]|uniref:Homeobox domain-containing protein n=1 Tax=Fasciola hepatica TaxID=6192 RepID=A0A4E0QXH4_FASHE|nr:hypothetical protein D915_009149 [Fasciola hepatica]
MRSHELFMRAHYPKTHPAATDAHQQPLLFHVSCFTCCVCQQPLAAGDPYTIDPRSNRPICRSDYLSSRDASECSARLSDSSELRRHALSLQPTTPSKQSESQNLGGNSREVHRNGHSLVIPSGCLSDSAGPTERYFDGKPLNSHTCHGNRRIRTSLTDEQRLHLHKAFEVNQRPSKLTRECLAHELGVPIRVVQVWFQNQRARDKRSSHSKRHWPRNQTEWSKTKPLSNTHVSPNALTPSPRTSVESGSNPDFGEISLGGLRCSGVPDLSSPKHSDSQPWRPAWPVSNDTDPTT